MAFVLLLIGLVWLGRRRSAEAPAEKSLASRLVAAAPPPAAGGEERLKELRAAVEANPTDLQAHLALLRFLYNREDAVGFEMAAESMAGYVGEGFAGVGGSVDDGTGDRPRAPAVPSAAASGAGADA